MGVKSFVNSSKTFFGNPDGTGLQQELVVPNFKKTFSKNVKIIWDKFENGTDEDTLKELMECVKNAKYNLEMLESTIREYSSYSDDKTDFI
jgi:hypothetical protein